MALVVILDVGCARSDWITRTLTLVDVTGTWEGTFLVGSTAGGSQERTTRWVLQQTGGKVRGNVQRPDGGSLGAVEGLVNGEVFSWQVTGPLLSRPSGTSLGGSHRGEATVNGDEMSGRADGQGCRAAFFSVGWGPSAEPDAGLWPLHALRRVLRSPLEMRRTDRMGRLVELEWAAASAPRSPPCSCATTGRSRGSSTIGSTRGRASASSSSG
jgi:hypothetical protein